MATAPLEPRDVEDMLRADLSTESCPVAAPPVPPDLGTRLPRAMAQRDGGVRMNAVVDSHDVTVSVWAPTQAEAMAEAGRLAGEVARLPWREDESTQCMTADLTPLPFLAPDPAHPTIPRAQFTASVTCRATT